MLKKLFVALTLSLFALFIFGGCAGTATRTQSVDLDFETLHNGTLILSGKVDQDTFKEFYRATSTGKRHYTLLIMTNGGCAYNTIAVMNQIEILQKAGTKFTMIVPGHGFSAGAYIFMMGDERIMYRGSQLMWHTMNGVANSNPYKSIPEDRKKMVDEMDNYVVNKFRERFPHIKEEWIKETFWDSNLTWMSAIEAKLMGICTKIIN